MKQLLAVHVVPFWDARLRPFLIEIGLDRPERLLWWVLPVAWALLLAPGLDLWNAAGLFGALLAGQAAAHLVLEHPDDIRDERLAKVIGLVAAASCFAVLLGWGVAVLLLCVALVWAGGRLRERSYLGEPLLAFGASLLVPAAWMSQGAGVSKILVLLTLATALWVQAQLSAIGGSGARLAPLFGRQAPWLLAGLLGSALLAFFFIGEQAGLGGWFRSGLALAAILIVVSVVAWRRDRPRLVLVLGFWWGAALVLGLGLDHVARWFA